ncbi:hypothetical protein ACWHBW_01885 [Streptomyces albidoflavus]
MNEITEQVTEFLTLALRRPVAPDDDYFALPGRSPRPGRPGRVRRRRDRTAGAG